MGGRGTAGWAICSWTSPCGDPNTQTKVHLCCSTHLYIAPHPGERTTLSVKKETPQWCQGSSSYPCHFQKLLGAFYRNTAVGEKRWVCFETSWQKELPPPRPHIDCFVSAGFEQSDFHPFHKLNLYNDSFQMRNEVQGM